MTNSSPYTSRIRRTAVMAGLLLLIAGCAGREIKPAEQISTPPTAAAKAEGSRYDPLILRLRETGRQRVALLGPDTAEVQLIRDRLTAAHAAGAVELVAVQLYPETIRPMDIAAAVRVLTDYEARAETLADFIDVFRYAYDEVADPQLALAAAMKDLQPRMGRAPASGEPSTPRLTDAEYGAALTRLLTGYRHKMQRGYAPHDAMRFALDELSKQEVLGEPGFDAVILPVASDAAPNVAPVIASLLADAGAGAPQVAIYETPVPARRVSASTYQR